MLAFTGSAAYAFHIHVKLSITVDPCENNNCQNGATCVSDGNRVTCSCTSLFAGVHCEIQSITVICPYIHHFLLKTFSKLKLGLVNGAFNMVGW